MAKSHAIYILFLNWLQNKNPRQKRGLLLLNKTLRSESESSHSGAIFIRLKTVTNDFARFPAKATDRRLPGSAVRSWRPRCVESAEFCSFVSAVRFAQLAS